jgi:hypothetical protein
MCGCIVSAGMDTNDSTGCCVAAVLLHGHLAAG